MDVPALNRRRLLQGLAATSMAAMAGCLGDGDDDGADPDEAEGDEEADLEEIQDGGRIEFPIERGSVGTYDPANQTQADDSMITNAVYDGLFREDREGNRYLWMAEEYDIEENQDIRAPDDYTDYMEEYEIVAVEAGVPAFDVAWPNIVIMEHPDDLAAVQDGDLGEGDTMRVLTREEAEDAALDGTYGTKVVGRLREGIEFHNGEEVTAENVVRSYDRIVGGFLQGQVLDSLLHAEAPDGDDGYTFELYSQDPDADALIELPPTEIFPSDHLELPPGEVDPVEGGPMPVGTGPYEIVEVEEGETLLLERTDNYWVDDKGLDEFDWWDDVDIENKDLFPTRPPINEINVRFVPDDSTRAAALEDGDVDIAYQLNPSDNTAFQNDDDFRVTSQLSTGFTFMQKPIAGAWEQQEVRLALSRLIPREDIVEFVEDGWADPARAPFPETSARIGTAGNYADLADEDWAYGLQPDHDAAEDLMDEAGVETPVDIELHTNADDDPRQDKVEIIADELTDSGLFEAEVETPADLNPWFLQDLAVPGAAENYGEMNATATMGLAGGFSPHGYIEAVHDPDNYNACCNFFYPAGTFDWIDDMRAARFSVDAAEDLDLRRERYDDLWPTFVETSANDIIDYTRTVVALNSDVVKGFNAYVDRRGFLTWSFWAPFDGQVAYLDR